MTNYDVYLGIETMTETVMTIGAYMTNTKNARFAIKEAIAVNTARFNKLLVGGASHVMLNEITSNSILLLKVLSELSQEEK